MTAHLTTCVCCSLLSGCIFTGIMTMFLYLMAFGVELWWIIEAEVQLPIPSYLLALIYFFVSIMSVAMLVGLRGKKTRLLLTWMIVFLLSVFPEAGMVLYMAVYYWSGGIYGIIELGMWVCRVLCSIIGTVCIHSLYSYWKDEKSVLRSLHELSVTTGSFHPHGIAGEYQKDPATPIFHGYNNEGYVSSSNHSNGHLNMVSTAMAITKYSSNDSKALKRSASTASQFVSASRLSLNDLGGLAPAQFAHMPLGDQVRHCNAKNAALQGRNEFDPSKFGMSLAQARWQGRSQSQWDLHSFGMDPDTPVFIGDAGSKRHKHTGHMSKSALQWYRPRSLINLDDEGSSIWSGVGETTYNHGTHSLDRRKSLGLFNRQKAQSLGALNSGYISGDEENLLHGGIPTPYFNYKSNYKQQQQGASKISLGQFSDHIDKYRDVAL